VVFLVCWQLCCILLLFYLGYFGLIPLYYCFKVDIIIMKGLWQVDKHCVHMMSLYELEHNTNIAVLTVHQPVQPPLMLIFC